MYYFKKTVSTPYRISEYVPSKTLIYKLRKKIITTNLANYIATKYILYYTMVKGKARRKLRPFI